MPKKKKAASAEASKKQNGDGNQTANLKSHESRERPFVRAIRVTPQLLEAAKTYRKEKGVSFYQLGLGAITERLVREGYLKKESSEPKA